MSSPERINRTSRVPPYLQLADVLRERIDALMDGELLPSISRLMAEFNVGRGVVRNALAELERDGLVVVEAGVGAFRRPRPPQAAIPAAPGDTVSTRPPTATERRYYDLPPSVSMLVLRRAGQKEDEAYPGDRTVIRITDSPG
ncbi:winged helix-turn-helix domain-containing protein [Actinocorallia sp. API 0066]|uniref:winged helix-turn-helix domain-containing protein n=1 Tax=Actinocorallia sp. API 0066 TaxID=2896846 RepID=UPI001E455317|nr:winged helix-turn-helix domain-containing protein [Actinocorallia sp. API 0066]MCD0453243.1 winged helix-turn-helix domain-containing protein [Actinocorallia sp. API 0066]